MRKTYRHLQILAAALPLAVVASPVLAQDRAHHDTAETTAIYAPITQEEVLAAQQAWGRALVAIATAYDNSGIAEARRVAEHALDTAYGYDMGPVLFKPTLAAAPQTFRTTREGALAYFIGQNPAYAGDTGFALKHWRSFEINNAAILISGNTAMTMGNVTLTDSSGNRTIVDKTWGYVRGADGALRIVLHHSSLPYAAN